MTFKDDLWSILENELFSFSTSEVLFNQYKQVDLGVDLPNANEIRKQNLMKYLESFPERPSILVVGEAAGPWWGVVFLVCLLQERNNCVCILYLFRDVDQVERNHY